MAKSPDAFRTISEVAEWLETPAHVLRFWETRFPQVRPVKRAGGRRYYRPGDVALLSGIKKLLHEDGMTIRGVQKLLREQGIRHVATLGAGAPGQEPTPEAAPAYDTVAVRDGAAGDAARDAARDGAAADPAPADSAAASESEAPMIVDAPQDEDGAPQPAADNVVALRQAGTKRPARRGGDEGWMQGDLFGGTPASDSPPPPAPESPVPESPVPESPVPESPAGPTSDSAPADASAPEAPDAGAEPAAPEGAGTPAAAPSPEPSAAAPEDSAPPLAARLRGLDAGTLAPQIKALEALADRLEALRAAMAGRARNAPR